MAPRTSERLLERESDNPRRVVRGGSACVELRSEQKTFRTETAVQKVLIEKIVFRFQFCVVVRATLLQSAFLKETHLLPDKVEGWREGTHDPPGWILVDVTSSSRTDGRLFRSYAKPPVI